MGWADANGFKFSQVKTKMIHFYRNVILVGSPDLKLAGTKITKSDCVRFLGLYWDSKLSWNGHIARFKAKCMKDLNLLRAVSTEEWGTDSEIIMRLYRAIIRPKIDYGSIVYGAASENLIKQLDTIQNEAMRISTGAFKSTPIKSLKVLANEMDLGKRREEQLLRYYCKIKGHFQNSAYQCIVDGNLELYFWSRS